MTQSFRYYLHDGTDSMERRSAMEGQGVALSEEAWERLGRPFYEVELVCEVTDDGAVSIVSASAT